MSKHRFDATRAAAVADLKEAARIISRDLARPRSGGLMVKKDDLATIKVARSLAAWIKREAARRGVTMYELVAHLISRGGERPWEPKR